MSYNGAAMNAPPPGIFKANDIRGIAGETLTADGARRIGNALAAAALEQGAGQIALGRDGRLSSPELAAALADGLCEGGIAVMDIGIVPTPALYYAAAKHCGGSGVMITGSHNPKNYNGMKMMLGGATLKSRAVRALYERIQSGNLASNRRATITTKTIGAEYIDAVIAANPPPIVKNIGDSNPATKALKIVVDAGNGAAGQLAPRLYRAMGYEVRALFCDIDGNFPNHHPDPARPENLADAAAAAAKWRADAAFVFDGDGDRLGVLLPDNKGGYENIFPDRLLMLFAEDMLRRNPGGGVVFDVKCSAALPPFVKARGGKADMQPTGHAFIKSQMKETGALLGGEMSGHFYFAEGWFGVDDALFAGARLARILSGGGGMDTIPNMIASPELLADMQNPHAFIERLQKAAAEKKGGESLFGDAAVVTIDGLRADYADGFGLVRASNTTPSLVFRFEGADAASLQRIQNTFRNIMQTHAPEVQLPF